MHCNQKMKKPIKKSPHKSAGIFSYRKITVIPWPMSASIRLQNIIGQKESGSMETDFFKFINRYRF